MVQEAFGLDANTRTIKLA